MDIPKTTETSFGGPRGAAITILLSPFMCLIPLMTFNKDGWNFRMPRIPTSWDDYFDLEATKIYLGFIGCHALFDLLPFGEVVEGQPLPSGNRLKYRCNGLHALMLSLTMYVLAVMFNYKVTVVYDRFIPFVVTGLIFALILSVLIYIKARSAPKSELAPRGNTGIMIYDFFVGHELNPRIGNFDVKFFTFKLCLNIWIMLDIIYLTKAWETQHYIPPTIAVAVCTQLFYLVDNLYYESNILTMVDVMHDGLGYFALNGFYAFCPVMYTLQIRFLLENPDHSLAWYCLIGIVLIFVVGYLLFRGGNSQKSEFRKNPKSPSVAHLKTVPTENGRGLLISGYWGICRKPNYLGDIIVAFAWSLTCGFGYVMPYFYPVFLTLLLVDREKTDSEHCRKKYKESWDRYCNEVKYRIFPYIY